MNKFGQPLNSSTVRRCQERDAYSRELASITTYPKQAQILTAPDRKGVAELEARQERI